MAKPTAREKLARTKHEKKVRLESDFAGVKAGQMLFVATPQIVDRYIRKIPYGEHRTVPGMRREMARRNSCDASCPVSTSIFVRISAEAALEALDDGAPESEIAPFWRILRPDDKSTKRLPIDPDWIADRRKLEGIVLGVFARYQPSELAALVVAQRGNGTVCHFVTLQIAK